MDHDDIFYAELERQILQLMAGDDEGDFTDDNYKHSYSLNGAKHGLNKGYTAAIQPGNYFDWTKNESSDSVPTWLLKLWRPNGSGNGTGVFIPHIVKSRTKNKNKKRNNDKGRTYKSMGSNKGGVVM
ncbi:hypothetical protein LguiA_032485 [Lonicera macranthoides]